MIAWSFIIVFLGMSRSNLSLPRYAHDIIKPDKQYGACKPSHLWLNQLFIRENTKSQLFQSKPHLSLQKTSHRWTFVNSFTLVNAFNRWCIRSHIWIKFFSENQIMQSQLVPSLTSGKQIPREKITILFIEIFFSLRHD